MCRLSVRLRVASLIFSPLSTHPVQSAPHSSFYLVTPLLPSGLCSNTPSQGGLLGHPTRPCPTFGALYPSSYSVCHTWRFMSLFTCLLHWNAGSMKASTQFCPLFSSPALGTQQWLNKHLLKEQKFSSLIHSFWQTAFVGEWKLSMKLVRDNSCVQGRVCEELGRFSIWRSAEKKMAGCSLCHWHEETVSVTCKWVGTSW